MTLIFLVALLAMQINFQNIFIKVYSVYNIFIKVYSVYNIFIKVYSVYSKFCKFLM